MRTSSSSDLQSNSRTWEIRQIVFEVLRKRSRGENISDDQVLAEYPDLVPELATELGKLRRVVTALDLLDDSQCRRALERIELDWERDRQEPEDPPAEERSPGDTTQHRRPREAALRRERETRSTDAAGGGSNDDSDTFPATIGRYRVHSILGAGGFGRVYLARDQRLARDVAIKVPHQNPATDQGFQAFLREARVAASLDHPAIVPVYDAGRTEDGKCYVVSKLIKGKDLAACLKQSRLPRVEAVRIVMTVAGALHHAHTCGLVHRDIKPANILLDGDRQPYLADFGLALKDQDLGMRRSYAGTPAYMSPEQARGEAHRVDLRSDIFSLGIVLYELIAGRKPFDLASHDELLQQIIWTEPPQPCLLDSSIPEELQRICLKALAKRAADRYATAAQLEKDLRFLWQRELSEHAVRRSSAETRTDPVGVIVPRGLRAFGCKDAEHFLDLVPGPRDRDGLPESIRQWKSRIEEPSAEEAFSVGLLYGPSGCGKSSLVCAGLLPRLAPHIRQIYLTATAEETEARLLRALHKQSSTLSSMAELTQCLAAVRCGHFLPEGEKLLLVLDQFEQWLHGKTELERRMLVQALRQCDGQRLQCLVLVRDDFWLAVSRFMAEMEVDLIQGHNAALVDLFTPIHARKVLAEFGRAFGHLPPRPVELDTFQEEFLRRAVAGLSEQDKVVPVRLALFAEMMKGKRWAPTTLRHVGGTAGIGLSFLEETFSSRTANPQNRFHETAARAVLEALLPEQHLAIRGGIRSYPELLEISGYGQNPRAFKELMRILDRETRLITPTDHAGDEADAGPGQRYYQLTHDYLIPSLREWLTKKQKRTLSGRAELRLADRTMMWNTKRERRQLPSLCEWIAIRVLTKRVQWTAAQQSMMRVAARRHVLTFLAFCAVIGTSLFAGSELAMFTRNLAANVRANAAVVWLALGRDDSVWPLLKHAPDPTTRTRVIHGLSLVVTGPEELLGQLERQNNLSIRRALVLIAGELIGNPRSLPNSPVVVQYSATPTPVVRELLDTYRDDPDPGMHAAAEWTLRRFDQDDTIGGIDKWLMRLPDRDRRPWYVTAQGHTMMRIAGPVSHSFYIASKETTRAQFQAFRRQQMDGGISDQPARGAFPVTNINWYEAVAYCNWLSQREGLPENQWCYSSNSSGEFARGMRLAPDFLNRSGYRLPTEAEWEYACRARATTNYSSGNSLRDLRQYAFFDPDAAAPWPVGQWKPNDFGIFDMHGNVAEWCQDRYRQNPAVGQDQLATEALDAPFRIEDGVPRVVRGGSWLDPPSRLRSNSRAWQGAEVRREDVGFRVARLAVHRAN